MPFPRRAATRPRPKRGRLGTRLLRPPVSPLSTLVDNFDDNSIDAAKWKVINAPRVREQGGRLGLAATTGAGNVFVSTQGAYTFDSIYLRVYPLGESTTSSYNTLVQVFSDAGGGVGTDAQMVLSTNGAGTVELAMRLRVGFVTSGVQQVITYSATDHAWWRIRRSGGNVLFDTAPDTGLDAPGTWTNRHTIAEPGWAGNRDCRLWLESARSSGTDDWAEFDNVNTATVPVVTAPTVSGTPQGFSFTATPTTVTYTGGGATGTDVFDVLCVASDATVATPAGWTLQESRVVNEGAYIFVRNGGTTSAAITLGAATNTRVSWVRIANATAVDAPADSNAGVDGVNGTSTPALTTPALSTSTELVVALAGLTNFTTTPTGLTWSTGYTAAVSGGQGTGGTAAFGAVATKTPAGTAAESPSLTWTNAASNRYILAIAFTGAATGGGPASGAATVTGAGAVTATAVRIVGATVDGAGSIAATVVQNGAAAVTGAGSVTAAPVQQAGSTVSGAGTATAAATTSGGGTATVSGAGAVQANAVQVVVATVAGAGSVTVAAVQNGQAAPAGAGSVQATVVQRGSSTVTGAGSVTASSSGAASGTAIVSGAGSVTGGGVVQEVVAAVTGAGSVTATVVFNGQSTIVGAGSVSASVVQRGSSTVSGAGSVTAVVGGSGAATVTGAGSVTATVIQTVVATVAGAGTVTTTTAQIAGSAIVGAGSTTASVVQRATAAVTGTGSITANALGTIVGAATVTGSGSVAATASQILRAGSTVTGQGATSAAGSITGAASVTGAGSTTASVVQRVTAAVTGAASVTATVGLTLSGVAAAAGAGQVVAVGRAKYTFRPSTGTTARPGAGTTGRPYAGVTSRP